MATVTADHPHPLGLDGQRRLGGLLLRDDHRAQVDDASAVWSRTSYPPGRVFTDEQAVTGTPHIFLPCWGVLDGCSFIADRALDHVLMQLPIQVDEGLADAAVDDGNTAGVRAGDGCVGRR